MSRLALFAILFVPFVASADPEPAQFYVPVGAGLGEFGPTNNQGSRGLVVYDGALALRAGEIWVRAAVTHASMNAEIDEGQLLEWHAGIEWKPEQRLHSGWFIGADAGWADGTGGIEDGGMQSVSAPFVMPRAGYEIGGEHVRLQFALELMFGYGHYTRIEQGDPNNVDGNTRLGGANLTVALTER